MRFLLAFIYFQILVMCPMVHAEMTIPPKNVEKQFIGQNNVKNPGAETNLQNWFEGVGSAATAPTTDQSAATADITFSRNTTTPLSGSADFKISKPASNQQGEFIATNIDLDTEQLYKPNEVSFTYEASSLFTYGSLDGVTPSDVKVFIADRTTSAIIPLFPNTLDGSGKFAGQFQAGANTNLQLILWLPNTDADAWDFYFDSAKVRLSEWAVINSDSDWQSYTPTFTGFGTVSNVAFQYRKEGTDILIEGSFTAGTATGTEARITLPTGLVTPSGLPTTSARGDFIWDVADANILLGRVLIEPSVAYMTLGKQVQSVSSSQLTKALGSAFTSSIRFNVKGVRIPIQGWTSGFTTADTVLQNNSATFSAYKNGGAITATTVIPTWTAVDKDASGAFNSSSGIFTVKIPGDYKVELRLAFTAADTSVPSILKNGAVFEGGFPDASTSVKGAYALMTGLVPGDTISVYNSTSRTISSSNTDSKWTITKADSPSTMMNIRKIATLKDEKAAGTDAGTFTSGSFVTRTLNTEVDPFGIVTLSANQFTLQPGTYRIDASAPAYFCNAHKAKLRNITASTDTILGTSEFLDTSVAVGISTKSLIQGVFSISVATAFEIQHRAGTTRATDGLGHNTNLGVVEVYTQVEIEKLL